MTFALIYSNHETENADRKFADRRQHLAIAVDQASHGGKGAAAVDRRAQAEQEANVSIMDDTMPPRDPGDDNVEEEDDDNDNDNDNDNERKDDREPAVIREPGEDE
jgi:hypothetical protein